MQDGAEMDASNRIVSMVNALLRSEADKVKDAGVALKAKFIDYPRQGIAVLISAEATEDTVKKAVTSHLRMVLSDRIIVFVNDDHNPELVAMELKQWGLSDDDDDVEYCHTGSDVREALYSLYADIEDGDTLFVGTIADFLFTDSPRSIDSVLEHLEARDVLLISHMELGCSYAELHRRLETSAILDDVLKGDCLCNLN